MLQLQHTGLKRAAPATQRLVGSSGLTPVDKSVVTRAVPVMTHPAPAPTPSVTHTPQPAPPTMPPHQPQPEAQGGGASQPTPPGPPIKVTLRLAHQAPDGCGVGVVGGAQELGSWNAEQAMELGPGPGAGMWRAVFYLPPDSDRLEYKYVLLGEEGAGGSRVQAWSPDPNRSLDLPGPSAPGASVTVTERWAQGPREVRVVLRPPPPHWQHSRPLTAAEANSQLQQLRSLAAQLRATGERLKHYDELQADMCQLVSEGPRPPYVLQSQLEELQGHMDVFQQLRDEVSALVAWDPLVLGTESQERVQAVQRKLTQFDLVESGMRDLICLLSAKGGCPVAYPVGKAIAAVAAARPRGRRPWSWS